MNTIVRSVQAFGLDLSVLIRFGSGHASASVAFEGHAPQGPQLQAHNSCDDSAVHDLMDEVHQLMKQACPGIPRHPAASVDRSARLAKWERTSS